jgi:hypothetical protein
MGTKATNINQGASDQAVILSGKGASFAGAGSIGDRNTFTSTTKALDFTGATTGNITFGDPNAPALFARTLESLVDKNNASLTELFAATKTATDKPDPGPEWLTGLVDKIKAGPLLWGFGALAILLAGWLLLRRK